jgi:hypothetical protein
MQLLYLRRTDCSMRVHCSEKMKNPGGGVLVHVCACVCVCGGDLRVLRFII